jgi:hypothetical protein
VNITYPAILKFEDIAKLPNLVPLFHSFSLTGRFLLLRDSCRYRVGDGFNVYPVFANKAFTKELSPFLMFDYAAPKYFPPTQKKLGVGEHPHRGFETVTMAFEGEVEHKDSAGNCGVIGPGDVQWMTAGRGIIHEEFHSGNFAKTGGTFEMYQLWYVWCYRDFVTLPASTISLVILSCYKKLAVHLWFASECYR